MKMLFRIAKVSAVSLLLLIALPLIAGIGFMQLSPEFGEAPNQQEMERFPKAIYADGKFQNQIPTSVDLGFRETVSIMAKFIFNRSPEVAPQTPPPMVKLDSAMAADRSSDIARLTWFGHSACLLEIDGRKIFLDPMLGQYAGPLPMMSPKRYHRELPLEVESLPYLDAVVISHDHYDHLDYGSIKKLKEKVGRFYVPVGVGAHLLSWGVPSEKITELSWWEEEEAEGFTFICAPARHFSGRGLARNNTLWASWVIDTPTQRFFFSGDSGYGPHFREVGEKYGPFDFAMMECGQYNSRWHDIHMMPEETVRAALDVKARILLPIHWGAFTLAMHPWTDPVTRVTAEARQHQMTVATPRIGESIVLSHPNIPQDEWWR